MINLLPEHAPFENLDRRSSFSELSNAMLASQSGIIDPNQAVPPRVSIIKADDKSDTSKLEMNYSVSDN